MYVSNDGVGLPALQFFFFRWRVDDDADGKKVVNLLKGDLFGIQFIPDGVNRLGPPVNLRFNFGLFQFLTQGGDELLDVLLPVLFGYFEFIGYQAIVVWINDFHAQILKLRFDVVQTQAVRQWGVHVTGFRSYFELFVPGH